MDFLISPPTGSSEWAGVELLRYLVAACDYTDILDISTASLPGQAVQNLLGVTNTAASTILHILFLMRRTFHLSVI